MLSRAQVAPYHPPVCQLQPPANSSWKAWNSATAAGLPSAELAPMPSSRKAPPIATSRAPWAMSKLTGDAGGQQRTRREQREESDETGHSAQEATPSGQQHRRAGRPARLEVHVGPGHLAQRVALVHVDGDHPAGHQVEQRRAPRRADPPAWRCRSRAWGASRRASLRRRAAAGRTGARGRSRRRRAPSSRTAPGTRARRRRCPGRPSRRPPAPSPREVSSFTFAGSSRRLLASRTSGWVQPACCASSALAALPTVPMTVAPR